MMRDEEPFLPAAYIDAASAAVGLPIPDACRAGVAQNLARVHAFARLLLEMEELAEVEPAPSFRPLEEER